MANANAHIQGDPMQTVKSNLPMTEWTKLLISHQKVILLSPRLGISFYITGFIFDLQTMCKMANFFITKSGIL